jgi:hypothetical protein
MAISTAIHRRAGVRRIVAATLALAAALSVAALPGISPASADTGTPLVGTFKITTGAQSGSNAATGSYFRMIQPGGNATSGPFLANADSSAADKTYTLFTPGMDGGLVTGSYQSQPSTGFDGNGNSLSGRIIKPTPFFGVNFGISTNAKDLQTGDNTVVPAISVDGSSLSGDLRAFDASWNTQQFNQGSPKSNGSTAGTTPVTGTYNSGTKAFSINWTSLIVGGPFNGFTGAWHLEGTFEPAAASAPAVTAVSPTSGPEAGGTSVTITGTNLADATEVKFGSAAASIVTQTATTITATAPAGTGIVDVKVTGPGGTSATGSATKFTYTAASSSTPTVTALSPSSGQEAGGTSVTITGTNLAAASAVKFGTAAASIKSKTATTVKVVAPKGTGVVDVTVTTPAGTSAISAADKYTYIKSLSLQSLSNTVTKVTSLVSALLTTPPAETGGIGEIFPIISLFGPFTSEAVSWLPVVNALTPLISPLLPTFGDGVDKLQPLLNVLVPILNDLEQKGFDAISPLYAPYRQQILDAENQLANAFAPYVTQIVNLPTTAVLQSIEGQIVALLGQSAASGDLPTS